MGLIKKMREGWRRRHPKTLEEIDPEDVLDEVVSPEKVVRMYEEISGLRFKYIFYPNPGEGAYFVCPDCDTDNVVSSYGFANDYCECGRKISPESEHIEKVVARAVGNIMIGYSGI